MTDLYPHQQTGIEFSRNQPDGKAILAFCVRSGKSATALLAARETDVVHITCPKTIVGVWVREITKWCPHWTLSNVVQVILTRHDEVRPGARIFIISDSVLYNVAMEISLPRPDFVIIDEAHRMKDDLAQRSRSAFHLLKAAPRGVALSGTIMPNRHVEMWPWAYHFLGLKNKKQFEIDYCGGYESEWGWSATESTNRDELAQLFAPIMLTLTAEQLKETIAPIMPPNLFYLDLDLDHREKEFTPEQILGGEISIDFEILSEIRKLDGLRKVEPALDYIERILQTETKVVVWAHHREVLELLNEGLAKYAPAMVHGGTEDRDEQIRIFQEYDHVRVFIGGITACGTGVCLDAAAVNIMVEATWVPGDIHQALARCGGPNQARAVRSDILTITNSLDGRVLRAILKKQGAISNLSEKTKMSKNQTPALQPLTDTAIRNLLEARAKTLELTTLGYVKCIFPNLIKAVVADQKEPPPHTQVTPITAAKKKKAAKKEPSPEAVEGLMSDPTPEPVQEPAGEEPDEVDLPMLRSMLANAIRSSGPEAVKKLLSDIGCAKLSEVIPEQYANLAETVDELVAGQ
jgi:SWI/SNF-related matrix-associated actin-dependent regulator 1 of chromatin subfamily A